MQAVLVMIRSDGERRSFSIARDMTVIGRREDCDLRIPLGEISRKHCRLVRDGDVLRVEDLGSSNGTYHNGERVQESILAPGDTIQIGPVIFALQIDGIPADEDLHPVAPQELASGGASDMDTEVTQGEYAPEGEYAEGEYAAEEFAGDEVAVEGDLVAEGDYVAEEQPTEEPAAEIEYAAAPEHTAQSAGAPTVHEEDELFLTGEQIVRESGPQAGAASHAHRAVAAEDERELEPDQFTLGAPQTPHDDLHLENLGES